MENTPGVLWNGHFHERLLLRELQRFLNRRVYFNNRRPDRHVAISTRLSQQLEPVHVSAQQVLLHSLRSRRESSSTKFPPGELCRRSADLPQHLAPGQRGLHLQRL